jgi:hypothetical protein
MRPTITCATLETITTVPAKATKATPPCIAL